MTADDRKTLEELREVLEAFKTGDNPIEADFIAALTRVLQEPTDEELMKMAELDARKEARRAAKPEET